MKLKTLLMVLLSLFYILNSFADTNTTLFDPLSKKKIFFVPQFSEFKEISAHELLFLKKILMRAEKENIRAVIFEMDTPGGDVMVAYKYLSVLAKSKVPTIAYLNPNGISAGAIIALGANRIAINPNGMIGDAMPITMNPGGMKPVTEHTEQPDSDKKDSKDTKEHDEKQKSFDKPPFVPTVDDSSSPSPALDELLKELQKMSPKPSVSDEKLLNQKFLTVFFKALQVLSEKNGRPTRVVRAMADPYQRLDLKIDGIQHDKVSPLTLSAKEAKALHIVDYIVRDRHDLVQQLKLENCELTVVEKSGWEQVVSFLTFPPFAGVLLALGLVGIFVEIKTPGFGVPGILGLTLLTLFFLGHVSSGASDWGPMVVFIVGLVLLLVEIFLIPGFGIIGILGLLCILGSFIMAFGAEKFQTAIYVVSTSFLTAIGIMIVLAFYLTKPIWGKLELKTVQLSSEGYQAHDDFPLSPGDKGTAISMLRPAGIAVIKGTRYDVITQGEFIEVNSEIEVLTVRGGQIIVGISREQQ